MIVTYVLECDLAEDYAVDVYLGDRKRIYCSLILYIIFCELLHSSIVNLEVLPPAPQVTSIYNGSNFAILFSLKY